MDYSSKPPGEDVRQLTTRMIQVQENLDLLIRSSNWVVWSCIVYGPTEDKPWFDWEFRRDFTQIIPPWLEIDALPGEELAQTFTRLRLKEDDDACNARAEEALLSGTSGYNQTFRVLRRDGGICWIDETTSIYPIGPNKWRTIGVCIDATERKIAEERLETLQAELLAQNAELIERERLQQEKVVLLEANARLEDLAATDGLTGVKNYRGFRQCLHSIWTSAWERRSPLSLIILDIDHFKQFNDAYGHPAGDDVLREIGAILNETARTDDIIARYGGEEFAVILPGIRTPGATAVAERFRRAIESAAWVHRPITASFGVATTLAPSGEVEALIDTADRALYRAKEVGRNRVCHASDGPRVASKGLSASPTQPSRIPERHPI